MKNVLLAALAGAALSLAPAVAAACDRCNDQHEHHAAAQPAQAAPAKLGPGEARVEIPVSGMHCDHCAARVQSALAKLEGVKWADVRLDAGKAVVVFEKAKLAPSKLVETIDALGYKAGAPVEG